jgi:hypothetical protein
MSNRFPRLKLEGPSTTQLSLEQRYETLENIFVHQFFQLYRLLGQRFGWEVANEIAGEVPEPSIPLVVEGYRKKFGLEGNGAALLSQVLQAEFQAEGSDVAVMSEEPSEATIDVLCPFGGMLQRGTYSDVKIERGLCDEGCARWVGRVGATIEPAVKAERLSWMGDGAPRCRFHLQASEPASSV